MPCYFFDLLDGDRRSPDAFGDDFDDLDSARQQAQAILADIAEEELSDGEDRTFVCDVRDEAGRVVYRGTLTYQGRCLP